jgi:hypothetical protein
MISLVQSGFYGQKRRKIMAKKDILDEILAEKPVLSQIKEEDVILEPLLEEIGLIEDENISSFVRSILVRSTDFWLMPSSFSGKYHPKDEHGEGGNVLHTKRVMRVAQILAESYGLTDEEKDMVFAAVLLHDIKKGNRYGDDTKFTYDPMHPYTVGQFVKKCQDEDRKFASESQSSTLYLAEDIVQSILRLVRCHLGPWSPVPETSPVTYLDMIVHIADNVASKVDYVVDGKDIKEDRWNV